MARGYVFGTLMALNALRNIHLSVTHQYLRVFINPITCRGLKSFFSTRSRQFSASDGPPDANCYIELGDCPSGYPYAITKEKRELITEGNPEMDLKLQELLLYMYLKKERGDKLPDELSIEDFKDLLFMRDDEVDYMLGIVALKLKRKKGSESYYAIRQTMEKERILKRQMRWENEKHPYLHYDNEDNSLFGAVFKEYQSQYYNFLMGQSLLFGQNVIFDCCFDSYMNIMQIRETAKELNDCISINRINRRPFAINLCNVEKKSRLLEYLKKTNHDFHNGDVPVHIHGCSYLDLFRKEDIVYLSPHVNQELKYHPEDVYVIGALNNDALPLSLKKARFEGVRCAKLPVGYRQLMKRSLVLGCHEVFQSLIIKKNTGTWHHVYKKTEQ